ncbi:MAG: hypothetical protein LLG14_20485 [Nocardiaceae bacterium]|nr:hypothetical protein [Nocardiaceae bacterium]
MTETQITRCHPAFDLVCDYLEHEVGRMHGHIPVTEDGAWVVQPANGMPFIELEMFLPGFPLNEAKDEILTRTRRIALAPGHRIFTALVARHD